MWRAAACSPTARPPAPRSPISTPTTVRWLAERRGRGLGADVVQAGETLQGIAAAYYGDAGLWYKIAEANGLSGGAITAGQRLTVPQGSTTQYHNASTFTPYDPARALGDVAPPGALPPKGGKGCGIVGQILSTVVAIAATYVFGPIGGNLVGQGFNNLIGVQNGFSWKSLGLSVLSSAVTAGVGSALGQGAMLGSQILGDVIRGAASSAITQGIATATGLQDNFSWVGVATAGIGAGVGGAVLRGLSGNKGSYDSDRNWN